MKKRVDLTDAQWFKSSLSNGGDNCLEIAFVSGVVALRDSNDADDPEGTVLIISEADYRAYTAGVAQGELLLP